MKKIFLIFFLFIFSIPVFAQYDEDTENGVVSFAGRKGFVWESADKKFEFKPYLMVQTAADFNWYDSEGLDPAYNQDHVHNSVSRFHTLCSVSRAVRSVSSPTISPSTPPRRVAVCSSRHGQT